MLILFHQRTAFESSLWTYFLKKAYQKRGNDFGISQNWFFAILLSAVERHQHSNPTLYMNDIRAQLSFLTVSITPLAKNSTLIIVLIQLPIFISIQLSYFEIVFVIDKINLHTFFGNRSYFDNQWHINVINDKIHPERRITSCNWCRRSLIKPYFGIKIGLATSFIHHFRKGKGRGR